MIRTYWKPGCAFAYSGADAQRVSDEIMEIGESATPQQIVEKAADDSTELHKCFEWDDATAAVKYRLHQARQVANSIVFKEENQADDAPPTRFFFRITEAEGYKPTFKIIRDDDEYEKLLQKALAELRAFRDKYKNLKELQSIFELIE